MFHGGTNFGFFSGANGPPYAATTTSYDYDALLTETGDYTAKYDLVRAAVMAYHKRHGRSEEEFGPRPEPLHVQHLTALPPVDVTASVSLFDLLADMKRTLGISREARGSSVLSGMHCYSCVGGEANHSVADSAQR